ncbi:hypothetical protein AGDE_17168 [Angomonas deanei]|nr:hypothetical protein AGDE_17168 [Angomonas deanei]|eukprot:EPY15119.1 hypothetical protein AGDE_17168 [Angomonas deanei]
MDATTALQKLLSSSEAGEKRFTSCTRSIMREEWSTVEPVLSRASTASPFPNPNCVAARWGLAEATCEVDCTK